MNARSLTIAGLSFAAIVLSLLGNVQAQLLTYGFSGTITEVTTNENNIVPDLMAGDVFTGYTTFDSNGWHQTEGIVFVSVNDVDLLFDGPFIYGSVNVTPLSNYAIRVGADTFGDIGSSTFSAGNFGPDLEDTDGSAGHTVPFPASLNLSEFEMNVFRIWGAYVATGDSINATGELDTFMQVPEPASWILLLVGSSCLARRGSRWKPRITTRQDQGLQPSRK